jgi:MAP/microtubule affinity-regulating kinase
MNKFRLQKTIGKGSYAIVKLGKERTTGELFAIKIYDKYKLLQPHRRKNLKREIQILNKLDHPSIITLFKTIET